MFDLLWADMSNEGHPANSADRGCCSLWSKYRQYHWPDPGGGPTKPVRYEWILCFKWTWQSRLLWTFELNPKQREAKISQRDSRKGIQFCSNNNLSPKGWRSVKQFTVPNTCQAATMPKHLGFLQNLFYNQVLCGEGDRGGS